MLGSLIIFLNGMRRMMFQLSGFYFKPTQDLWFGPGVGGGCSGELCSVFRVEGLGFSQSEFCWKFGENTCVSIFRSVYHPNLLPHTLLWLWQEKDDKVLLIANLPTSTQACRHGETCQQQTSKQAAWILIFLGFRARNILIVTGFIIVTPL